MRQAKCNRRPDGAVELQETRTRIFSTTAEVREHKMQIEQEVFRLKQQRALLDQSIADLEALLLELDGAIALPGKAPAL